MKVLCVVSQKGGVGKTTVSLNLGYALAVRGWRTLVVDTDPQGGIAGSLTGSQNEAGGLAGFVANSDPLESVILKTRIPEFDLLPIGAMAVTDSHAFGSRMEDGQDLERLLDQARVHHDIVVLDTPSGFGGTTLGALRVSDVALCPVQAEPLALRSLSQMLEVVGELREAGSRIKIGGLLLTMLQQRNKDSLDVATEVWMRLPADLVLQTTIPRDPEFLAASAAGVPLGLLRRRPLPLAGVFDQLATEIERSLELNLIEKDDGPVSLFA